MNCFTTMFLQFQSLYESIFFGLADCLYLMCYKYLSQTSPLSLKYKFPRFTKISHGLLVMLGIVCEKLECVLVIFVCEASSHILKNVVIQKNCFCT